MSKVREATRQSAAAATTEYGLLVEAEATRQRLKTVEALQQEEDVAAGVANLLAQRADFTQRITDQTSSQVARLDNDVRHLKTWVRFIYGEAARTGMPKHEGANGWWQQALIESNPLATRELQD